jgi:hypothetical protein
MTAANIASPAAKTPVTSATTTVRAMATVCATGLLLRQPSLTAKSSFLRSSATKCGSTLCCDNSPNRHATRHA